jgi:hypothetical protein
MCRRASECESDVRRVQAASWLVEHMQRRGAVSRLQSSASRSRARSIGSRVGDFRVCCLFDSRLGDTGRRPASTGACNDCNDSDYEQCEATDFHGNDLIPIASCPAMHVPPFGSGLATGATRIGKFSQRRRAGAARRVGAPRREIVGTFKRNSAFNRALPRKRRGREVERAAALPRSLPILQTPNPTKRTVRI